MLHVGVEGLRNLTMFVTSAAAEVLPKETRPCSLPDSELDRAATGGAPWPEAYDCSP